MDELIRHFASLRKLCFLKLSVSQLPNITLTPTNFQQFIAVFTIPLVTHSRFQSICCISVTYCFIFSS